MNAMHTNDALTENGSVTHSTSDSSLLDLFFTMGALRSKPDVAVRKFQAAYSEDPELACRMLICMRDRDGVGERELFKQCLKWLIQTDKKRARKIVKRIPDLGRWDDLSVVFQTKLQGLAVDMIRSALESGNQLCAKWIPRRGLMFNTLFREMKMTPKAFRKLLSGLNNTVEKQLCAQDYENIDFSKVPSKASALYQATFSRHSPEQYGAYREGLEQGTETIHATGIYPYEILRSALYGDDQVATQQWKSQPDYFNGSTVSIMPVIDVSGSMTCSYITPSINVRTAAVSIGLYIAEHSKQFPNEFITFSGDAHFSTIMGDTLSEKYNSVVKSTRNMSTNLHRVFTTLLDRALECKLSQEDMPDCLLILSDMEFDSVTPQTDNFRKTKAAIFAEIENLYAKYNYTMPSLVFWNLDSRSDNIPVKMGEHGTALVSGFSTQIMTSILKGVVTPYDMMIETIMDDRYSF